jgi:uncharacterized protein (DUF3820 family)
MMEDIRDLKVVGLGSIDDFGSIIANLIASKTSLSETDKQDVLDYFKASTEEDILKVLPDTIPLKENVGYVCQLILEYTALGAESISKYVKTATDVLRLAVSMSDGDVSLAKNTKFKSFKRKERRLIISLLDKCNSIEEDMNRYKNVWIALGERLHPAEFKGQFIKVQHAFRKLRNNEKIFSFNGSVQGLIDSGRVEEASAMLATRPGDFARKLDLLLRTSEKPLVIATQFTGVVRQVSTPVLLQVIAHFQGRQGEKADLRTFFPKGSIAKVQSIENKLPDIEADYCSLIVKACQLALEERFSEKESLGKVYVDPRLKGYLVPFSQRSASRALKTIVRGSRVAMPEGITTIRSFIYWKNGPWGQTDVDLSAVFYADDFQFMEQVTYWALESHAVNAAHSGDITDATYGATEFLDMDIQSALNYGVRYIVTSINLYRGDSLVDLPECFMGWMGRKNPASGEIYEPSTVENKIDITADTRICIPMILDLKNREVIWTDIALKKNPSYVNNVARNEKSLVLMARALTSLKKYNLYDLFTLHAKARGELVENKEDADTIFSVTEGVTPFDTDVIMGQYL